jgi:hypothetical protein
MDETENQAAPLPTSRAEAEKSAESTQAIYKVPKNSDELRFQINAAMKRMTGAEADKAFPYILKGLTDHMIETVIRRHRDTLEEIRRSRGLPSERTERMSEGQRRLVRQIVQMNAELTRRRGQAEGNVATKEIEKKSHAEILGRPAAPDVSGESEGIRNGQRCAKLIDEIQRAKKMCLGTGRTMAEVQQDSPDWEIWKVIKNLPAEDQEMFAHPNRWGPVVGYGHGLLAKEYGKSHFTIGDWIKAYRRKSRE